MYDWPEIRPETDALWAALSRALRARRLDAPEALDRDRPCGEQWRDPDLLLSQTCGYPYVTALRGTVRLVATPVYVADGCEGPTYRSAVVVRADDPARSLRDLRGRTAACNATDSQSGYSAFRAMAAPLAVDGRFFAETVETGAHLNSMIAVAEGHADCAAIDCVCWALAEHCRGDVASRLRVVGWSPSAPALPFVTAARRGDAEVDAIRAAFAEVFADPATAGLRRSLLIAGVEVLEEEAYDAIAAMEKGAVAAGYPKLA